MSASQPDDQPAGEHVPDAPETYNESEYDSSDSDAEAEPPKKEKSHRPGDNAFQQQRLKAYNPVFTAQTVVPLLVVIAIIFVPLGAAMWYASHRVQDFAVDYTHCENLAVSGAWSPIPDRYLELRFRNSSSIAHSWQWRLDSDDSQPFEDERKVCSIQFEVPVDLSGPLYMFYRLKNFHQNHRRYAKSFSEDQIQGKHPTLHTMKTATGQNCSPLSDINGTRIYPCGLIANSLFNDTFSSTLRGVNGTTEDYVLTNKGIAWATNPNRFKKTSFNYTEVVPPPNWYKRFPDGYNETNMPDISTWEEFQNWMQTAGLPEFNKLALRNDHDVLHAGIYEIQIGLHFPVLPYEGRKYVYFSQRSVMGGKNSFLGIAWMAGGGTCLVLGIFLLAANLLRKRKAGDPNLLSWNKERAASDEAAALIAEKSN